MLRRILIVLVAASCHSSQVFAQCSDPFDARLCVYQLTGAEEVQFSTTDGQVSAFWSNWTGRDYIELIPPDNCYRGKCGFAGGQQDAMLTIRGAATGLGIYIYSEVQDNVWMARSDSGDGDDSIHFFFDRADANEIFVCYDIICLERPLVTFDTWEFSIPMDRTTHSDSLTFGSYDRNLWVWKVESLSLDSAMRRIGLSAELIELDSTHRVRELFLPWDKYCSGLPVGTQLASRRFAFSGGYDDIDGDTAIAAHCLRWPYDGDPWSGTTSTFNYWGDLLLPDDMPPVDAYQSVTAASPARRPTVVHTTSTWYDLRGRQLRSDDVRMPRSAVLHRIAIGVTTVQLHLMKR